jgi:thiamine-monophosphate kinase
MDNTDGVAQTLSELAEVNNVGVCLNAENLPIHELSYRIADFLKQDAIQLLLGPGADFQLIGTVAAAAHWEILPSDVRAIGEIVAGHGVVLKRQDKLEPVNVPGWNYFLPDGGLQA